MAPKARPSSDITERPSPEHAELKKKLVELAELEARLAEQELDLATLQAELLAFEARYARVVGQKLAEVDAIEAEIAQLYARDHSHDNEAQERARQTRLDAEESAHAAYAAREGAERFAPSLRLKKAYRDLAKQIHPDLAADEEERTQRAELMARANRAYQQGDEAGLAEILEEWRGSPAAVRGDDVGAELVRAIRQLADVSKRIDAIADEVAALEGSELNHLRSRVAEAESRGEDLLQQMVSEIEREKSVARERLATAGKEARH